MHTPAGPPVARRRARVLYCVVIATLVSGLGITIAAQNKVRPLPLLALPSVSLSLSRHRHACSLTVSDRAAVLPSRHSPVPGAPRWSGEEDRSIDATEDACSR